LDVALAQKGSVDAIIAFLIFERVSERETVEHLAPGAAKQVAQWGFAGTRSGSDGLEVTWTATAMFKPPVNRLRWKKE